MHIERHEVFTRFIIPCLPSTKAIYHPSTSHIECQWNDEHLIINENIQNIRKGTQIIFFELMDILATELQRATAGEDGWYRICWAFLKPGDGEHYSNVDKRNCLQLYRYRRGKGMSLLPIFEQWKSPKQK